MALQVHSKIRLIYIGKRTSWIVFWQYYIKVDLLKWPFSKKNHIFLIKCFICRGHLRLKPGQFVCKMNWMVCKHVFVIQTSIPLRYSSAALGQMAIVIKISQNVSVNNIFIYKSDVFLCLKKIVFVYCRFHPVQSISPLGMVWRFLTIVSPQGQGTLDTYCRQPGLNMRQHGYPACKHIWHYSLSKMIKFCFCIMQI